MTLVKHFDFSLTLSEEDLTIMANVTFEHERKRLTLLCSMSLGIPVDDGGDH